MVDYRAVDSCRLISSVDKVHEIARDLVNKKSASEWQILDTRPLPYFTGEIQEATKHSGHISGSKNVSFLDLVDQSTGCLKSDSELRELFARQGVDLSK